MSFKENDNLLIARCRKLGDIIQILDDIGATKVGFVGVLINQKTKQRTNGKEKGKRIIKLESNHRRSPCCSCVDFDSYFQPHLHPGKPWKSAIQM